jgi:hypothetical protein
VERTREVVATQHGVAPHQPHLIVHLGGHNTCKMKGGDGTAT